MANFDTLKGVSNFADMDLTELISSSYIMYLDWGFLDIGAFTNVKLNDTNIYGANRSQLRLAYDPQYTNGQVWETFHNNIVWESGVSVNTQPIPISGIYVNNTFYPSNTVGPYKHRIEYPNGRVIFDSPISTSGTVNMEYSYKTISVVEARDIAAEIQFRSFDPYQNNYLQFASGEYNKGSRVQLPLIGVEVSPRIESKPYELGNYAQKRHTSVTLHVVAENDSMAKKLISILSDQQESTTFIINMDRLAESGAFPLAYDGTLNSNPMTYKNIVNTLEYQYCKASILKAVGQNGEYISTGQYVGSVTWNVETIY